MSRGAPVCEAPLPWVGNCIAASHTEQPLLFVGAGPSASHGVVGSLALPLTEDSDDDWTQLKEENEGVAVSDAPLTVAGPSAGCAAMQLSHDGSRLFVAGCDGSIVVYDVRDKDGRVPVSDVSAKVPWCEEVLISLIDFEDRKAEVRELRDQLSELQSNSEYSIRMKEIGFRDQLKKLNDK